MKPIPTAYAGQNFRSRLEARWAAFFDLIDWRWVYEPFDLPGWTPDFLIEDPDVPFLVEVKPCAQREDLWERCSPQMAGSPREWIFMAGVSPRCCSIREPLENVVDPRPFPTLYCAVVGLGPEGYYDREWRLAGNRVQWKPARV